MARRGNTPKRRIGSDALYNNVWVQKFINKIMIGGKKSTAEKILYAAFAIAEKNLKANPIEIFEKALKNISPLMEVKARRVGGATYQIPIEVSTERGVALAMKWLREFSRQRAGHSMEEKLAGEIMDAYNNTGLSIKKREDVHKTAEANKAFAHFRW